MSSLLVFRNQMMVCVLALGALALWVDPAFGSDHGGGHGDGGHGGAAAHGDGGHGGAAQVAKKKQPQPDLPEDEFPKDLAHPDDSDATAHSEKNGDGGHSTHADHGTKHSDHGDGGHSKSHRSPASESAGHGEHAEHASPAKSGKPGFFAFYWESFLQKLDQMRHLDEHNEALRKRMSLLELENSQLKQHHMNCQEISRATQLKEQSVREGGLETARTISSLTIADDKLLSRPPKIIFEKALKAFVEEDFESAAKAFVFLTDNHENETYQEPRTYYMAGVSLFKVGNYKRANHYFEKAAEKSSGNSISYAPRALSWIALCHAKLGDKSAERKAVKELIHKFPNSKEARRLNKDA